MRSLAIFAPGPVISGLRPVFVFALLAVLFAGSLSGCSGFGVPDETVGWSAEKIYNEAKDEMGSGNWNKASKMLEKLEARFPYGLYAQQGQLDLAYSYFKDQEPTSAIAACDRFIKLHPNHPSVDYAYYLKGLVTFNDDLGLLGAVGSQDLTERDPKAARESFDSFQVRVQKFPNSRYTPDATARMKYLVNALASSEVHIARFYLRRGAYLAAANRAQTALKDYAEAPATEEGLAIMIAAYDKLGMTDLRDDAQRVLSMNFPKSRWLVGYTEPRRSWYRLW
jgi:outer membrane protein assembly factor BamD